MLTQRMMIQIVADKLAGGKPVVAVEQLTEPWRTCYETLNQIEPGANPAIVAAALLKALQNRPDRNEIVGKIFATQPSGKPSFPSLAEIADSLPPIEFVWDQWLPRGMLTVFGASQGAGKSFLALDLAYRCVMNIGWPDGAPIMRPGANVIYIDAEGVPQILNERASHYGIDREKLYLMTPPPGGMIDFGTYESQDHLVEMSAALEPELIVIDSLSSIHTRGQNNIEDVRSLLSYFTQLAAYYRTGLLLLHHIRKPGLGQQMLMFDLSMEDLSGSGHITAMARVVWGLHVIQTSPEPDPNGPRKLKMLKTNLGAYAAPLSFQFAPFESDGVYLDWSTQVPEHYTPETKTDTCEAWLEILLSEATEPLKPADIIELARQEGFGRSTVYRARKNLGSKIKDSEGYKCPANGWVWAGKQDPGDD